MRDPETGAFRRRFGEAYQTHWVYGDGSVDLVEEISKFTEMGGALAASMGLEDLKIDEGGFRLLRPLITSQPVDTLLLLERYDNIGVWATGEMAAQTSPVWMQGVLANAENKSTWLGDGYIMVDDANTPARTLATDRISVDWMTFDPSKKAALVDFPDIIDELAQETEAQGFNETAVRYFAMTTASGIGQNFAHLWIEHTTPALMGEVLAWRQSAPELADWRRRLNALAESVVSHHLLTQVA